MEKMDLQESDSKVAEKTDAGVQKVHKKKTRKIRRLAEKPAVEEEPTKIPRSKFRRRLAAFLFILTAASVGYAFHSGMNRSAFRAFLHSYTKQYYQILYDQPDYCEQRLDAVRLLKPVREIVLHQDEALKEFERTLQSNSRFNRIAITGPCGVGKTLFAKALRDNFAWQQNARAVDWNFYSPSILEKTSFLRDLVDDFSECGGNLLILDRLSTQDTDVVAIVNALIANMTDASRKHITVVYVFNLKSMLGPHDYEEEFRMVQSLPETKTINFKSFGVEEVKDCIRREAASRGIMVTESLVAQILASMDVQQSGCKKVYAKLLMYGRGRDD